MTIRENVSIAPYTTLKVGGIARYCAEVTDEAELVEAISFAREKKVEYTIIGGGSNILVSDEGFSGLVILMRMRGITHEDASDGKTALLRCAAGEDWDYCVAYAVQNDLWGIENLSGIPGTVGASPVQNIGAYGTEVRETIEQVRVYDPEIDAVRDMTNTECEFGYRTSIWKRERVEQLVVLRVTFRLSRRARPNVSYKDLTLYFEREGILHPSLAHIRSAVLEIRGGKFPDLSAVGTAGSFWKNPTVPQKIAEELKARYPELPVFPVNESKSKLSLAWILDHVCELKGHAHGRAALYENQPLVLIAFPSCTSFEIDSLALHVSKIVHEKTGIVIEREVVSLDGAE
jgi:UDP-N-acetylmuramate dehydrogenase